MEPLRAVAALPALILCGLWSRAFRDRSNDFLDDWNRIKAQYPDAECRRWDDYQD